MKMYAKLSRNLFDMSKVDGILNYSLNPVSGFEKNSDRTFIVRPGVYNYSVYFNKPIHLSAGTYTLSCKVKSLTGNREQCSFGLRDIPHKFIYCETEDTDFIATFELPDGDYYIIVQPHGGASNYTNIPIQVSDIMLNKGDKALSYEPYMPIQPIKFLYKSRQLFDRSLPKFSGWAYIDNFTDNTITVIERQNVASTTTWRSINIPIYGLEEGDTITISGEWVNSSNNKGAVMVRWFEPSSLGVGKICAELHTSGGVATGVVIAKPTETAQLCVALYINTNGTLAQYDTVTYKNVMVCKGDKALPYEPYMPLTKMKAFYKSRNLLPKDLKLPATVNGVTYTDNKDGSFTVNGTATSNAPILLGREIPIKAGTYTFKNHNAKIGTDCWIDISGGKHYSLYPRQDSLTFTIEEDGLFRFGYHTYNNTIQDNYIVRLMLNEGSTALPYEPPQEYPN